MFRGWGRTFGRITERQFRRGESVPPQTFGGNPGKEGPEQSSAQIAGRVLESLGKPGHKFKGGSPPGYRPRVWDP